MLVNIALLRNPVNWLTVWAMLALAGWLVHFFLQLHNKQDAA